MGFTAHARPFVLAFTAFVVLIATLSIPTPVAGQVTGGWTRVIIPSTTGVIDEVQGDNNGDAVGVAYHYSGSGKLGFSYTLTPTVDSSWLEMNGDLTAGATNAPQLAKVLWVTGSTWLVGAVNTGSSTLSQRIFRSTDNGATWSTVFSHNSPVTSNPTAIDMARGSATRIGATCDCEASGGGPDYIESTDGGATWNTFNGGNGATLGNNAGADGAASTSNNANGGSVALGFHGGAFEAYYMHPTVPNQGYHSVAGVGASWTVSYGNPTCYNDLGTTVCLVAQATGSFGYGTNAMATGNAYTTRVLQSAALTNGYAGGLTSLTMASSINPVPANQASGAFTNMGTCASGTWQTGANHPAVDANANDVFVMAWTCGANGLVIKYMQPTTTPAWTTTYTAAGINSNDVETVMTDSKSFVFYTNSTLASRFELVWTNTPTASAPAGATLTRTLTGKLIEGADVDPYSQAVVLRVLTSAPAEQIYALDPTTLADKGATPVSNACTFDANTGSTWRRDGVMAYHSQSRGTNFLGYLDCTTTSHLDANHWHVTGGDLNAPDQSGTPCTDWCVSDVTSGGNTENNCGNHDLPARAVQIDNIATIPMAWSNSHTSGADNAVIGFGFSDHLNGNIGVWDINQVNNLPDFSCQDSKPFSAPGATYQICSWHNGLDNEDYLAAVSPSAQTKVWRVSLGDASTIAGVPITMTQVVGLSSPWDQAVSVGCAGRDLIVMNTVGHIQRVHVTGTALGSTVWSSDAVTTTPGQRYLDFSRDGNWTSWVDGSTLKVGNGNTGAVTCTFSLPTGSVQLNRLSYNGQTDWVFLNDGLNGVVAKYDVHTCTTVTSVPDGTGGNGQCTVDEFGNCIPNCTTSCSSTTTSTGITGTPNFGTSIFGGLADGMAGLFGGNAAMGKLAVAIIVIIGFAGIGYDALDKAPTLGAILGGLLGLVLSLAIGYFPIWPIVVSVVLALAYLWYRTRG